MCEHKTAVVAATLSLHRVRFWSDATRDTSEKCALQVVLAYKLSMREV